MSSTRAINEHAIQIPNAATVDLKLERAQAQRQ